VVARVPRLPQSDFYLIDDTLPPKNYIRAKFGAYRQFLHTPKRRLPGYLSKWLGVQIQTGSLLLMLYEDSKIPW
jgi:hypothetical protein